MGSFKETGGWEERRKCPEWRWPENEGFSPADDQLGLYCGRRSAVHTVRAQKLCRIKKSGHK